MTLLVDTSIWVDILRGTIDVNRKAYRQYLSCAPVLQEVLQGLREGPAAALWEERFRNIPLLSDPLSSQAFLAAADIYRQGRRLGFTIRSTNDCLIAAIAIENGATIWHRDRDFDTIARFTNLRVRSSLTT